MIAALVYERGSRTAGADDFRAWEHSGADATPDGGLLVPSSSFRPARQTTKRPNPGHGFDEEPRRVYQQGDVGEDRLNRAGPEGSEAPPPKGASDSVAAAPTIDKNSIREGIETVRPIVKGCYEEVLREFPDAVGTVTLSFRIAAQDDVGRVDLGELDEANTTLFDEKLHDCMMQSIAELTFPVPGDGGVVNVTYPFVFESDQELEPGSP